VLAALTVQNNGLDAVVDPILTAASTGAAAPRGVILRGSLLVPTTAPPTRFQLVYSAAEQDADDLGLASVRLVNAAGVTVFEHYPSAVQGVDRQGERASGRFDEGLLLNAGISGQGRSGSAGAEVVTVLRPGSLEIGGTALDAVFRAGGGPFTVEMAVVERNDSDTSTEVRLNAISGDGPPLVIAAAASSAAAEVNPDWQPISRSVSLDETPPAITLDGDLLTGRSTLSLSRAENNRLVGQLAADEPVRWALHGADAGLFAIAANGQLRFRSTPDYEVPTDRGADNSYDLTVRAIDASGNSTRQELALAITNVVEVVPSRLVVSSDRQGILLRPGTIDGVPQRDGRWVDLGGERQDAFRDDRWVGLVGVRPSGRERGMGALGQAIDRQGEPLSPPGTAQVKLQAGETLRFNLLQPPQRGGARTAAVRVRELDEPETFAIRLDRGRADRNRADDTNLLAEPIAPPEPAWVRGSSRLQRGVADGLLDLRRPDEPDGRITLRVDLRADAGSVNRVGVVPLDLRGGGAGGVLGSVDGVLSSAGASFREAVSDALIGFGTARPVTVNGNRPTTRLLWRLDPQDQGVYALAMENARGEVFTFGTSTASDGRAHLRMLGTNLFGFEDNASSRSDFDYTDAVVRVRPV